MSPEEIVVTLSTKFEGMDKNLTEMKGMMESMANWFQIAQGMKRKDEDPDRLPDPSSAPSPNLVLRGARLLVNKDRYTTTMTSHP